MVELLWVLSCLHIGCAEPPHLTQTCAPTTRLVCHHGFISPFNNNLKGCAITTVAAFNAPCMWWQWHS